MSLFGSQRSQESWRRYCCGLYYNVTVANQLEKLYLPQVELNAHATILSTTSRTTLTQTFVNPSDSKGIKEVRYTFPLYDGVSVVEFTCHVDDRTIVGEVKEKEKAKAVFKEAVARGETAGLFEQLPEASDVFTTTVGNIPPGAKVIIQITYLGELKHDLEVDGIRFTIPNIICPRYGKPPVILTNKSDLTAQGKGISITVDAEMAEGSFLQKVLSPSHPIAVSMGTTSLAPNSEPKMTKASATLSLGATTLDTDFVLQIVAKDTGVPKAILETHPTIPHQKALMATLVPKFALPPEKPELVFVCDRSGSMAGSRINLVVQALKIFLKSLPVGVKFNICSFGSGHSFLWPNSKTYSQETLDEAMRHAQSMDASLGGTEMFRPLKSTIEQRYKDIPLDVMLLTDGEIWDQQNLFDYLNKEVIETKSPIRVFTLGIGNGVSHSLIEGIARAGNGFSQVVGEGEKMNSKVVRMLKGALSPHINDYALEVKYSDKDEDYMGDEDDFEIVEKVADSLKVNLTVEDEEVKEKTQKKISLFDTSVDPDKEEPPAYDETGEARYAHLPKINVPNIIQAPQNIPTLFAFNRTTVYLLMGPSAPQKPPKSVVLRGTSAHGPLELEIPIQILETPGETIHQLAAKKATFELEQGRGWLSVAQDESGQSLKEKFPSRFEDMLEREAVRLGVEYQVGGRWCSFVAVEKHAAAQKEKEDYEWLDVAEESKGASTEARKSKYKFAFQSESDEDEDGSIDLSLASAHVQRLRTLSAATSTEVDMQNQHISRISAKTDKVDDQIAMNRSRLARIDGGSTNRGGPPPGGMKQQIAMATERGDRIHTLGSSSADLSAQSKAFYKSAKKSSSPFSALFGNSQTTSSGGLFGSSQSTSTSSGGLFGNSQSTSSRGGLFGNSQRKSSGGGGGFFSFARNAPPPPPPAASPASSSLFGGASTAPGLPAAALAPPEVEVDMALMAQYEREMADAACMPLADEDFEDESAPSRAQATAFGQSIGGSNMSLGSASATPFGSAAQPTGSPLGASPFGATSAFGAAPNTGAKAARTDDELLQEVVGLQTFEGFWEWNAALFQAIGISEANAQKLLSGGLEKRAVATALAIAFLETKLQDLLESWELVVEKARAWLGEAADETVAKARSVL